LVNLKETLSKAADWFAGTSSGKGKVIEGSGLQNLSAGLKTAAVAVPLTKAAEIPGLAAKAVVAAKGVAASVGSSIGNYVKSNPIKSIAGGAVVTGAVVANPKIATSAPSKTIEGLYNTGYNIGQFTKNPTTDSFGKIYADNPIIAGGLTAAGLYTVGKGAGAIGASLLNTGAIKEQTDALKSSTPTNMLMPAGTTTPQSTSTSVPALAAYPSPETGLTSYQIKSDNAVKKYKPRKKTQNLNTRPINIRNNIMIANKNG